MRCHAEFRRTTGSDAVRHIARSELGRLDERRFIRYCPITFTEVETMDTEKWKSVVIPIKTYEILKKMAEREHRTLSGQFTFMIEKITNEEKEITK